MTITLRPYQVAAVQSIFDYFNHHDGNPVLALPTGAGKSLVIADFIKRVFTHYPGQRIMMLTHVKELIAGNHEELMLAWPTAPAGIYSAGLGRRDMHYPITSAGIASVYNKADQFGHIDLILIDECHLVGVKSTGMYLSFIEQAKRINPMLKVIGFSATPYRLGLGLITEGGLFTDYAFDNTRRDDFTALIDAGYLVPLIPKRTDTQFDLDAVSIRGGEYVPEQLQRAVDKFDVTRRAVDELVHHGIKEDRRHWLIFGAGIEHVEHIADALRAKGIATEAVHSKMADDERDRIIKAFKQGEIMALVNNSILTTGFNYPALDMIGMLRPTVSPGLWVQMLGRGTRPAPHKTNCLVLDFAGNTARLGPINDPVMPKKRGMPGAAPVKLCPMCSTYCHAAMSACPACGYEYPPPERQKIGANADTLDLVKRVNMVETKYGSIEAPVIADFKVTRVTYQQHDKIGKPPSMKVTYICGLRKFTEYVCFEHSGFPHLKATKWWEQHSDAEMPETTAEALAIASTLPVPAVIKVWTNSAYPEVMKYDFTLSSEHSGQASPDTRTAQVAHDNQLP